MPTNRKRRSRKLRRDYRELTFLELFDGLLCGHAGAFADGEEGFRRAWEVHRDELLGESSPGKRPGAWWRIEAGETPPAQWGGNGPHPWVPEAARLFELGALSPAEFADLDARARRSLEARAAEMQAAGAVDVPDPEGTLLTFYKSLKKPMKETNR